MALAGRAVTAGPATRRGREYGVRFTRPVVVPDDDEGAVVELTGTVTGIAEDEGPRVATIAVTARCDGKKVLGRAVAEVVRS